MSLRTFVGLVFCSATLAQVTTPRGWPRPMDPLGVSEKRIAEEIVGHDNEVVSLLGRTGASGHYRLCFIELVTPTPPESGHIAEYQRKALVVLYNRDTDRGISAVVDLKQARVVEKQLLVAGQIPLAPEDVSEVLEILRVDPIRASLPAGLQSRLQATSLDISIIHSTDEADACRLDRCFNLAFRLGNYYLTNVSAIVNLTRGTVTRIDK